MNCLHQTDLWTCLLRAIFKLLVDIEKSRSLWEVLSLGSRIYKSCLHKKVGEPAPGSKPVSSNPPLSLLQFLPCDPALAFLNN